MKKYCVLGTDKRSVELRKLYKYENKDLVDYKIADVIIAPIPFTKDNITVNEDDIKIEELINCIKENNSTLYTGGISKETELKLKEANIKYINIMSEECIAIKNAIPTAEGAISIAINNTDITLYNSNILVLGYGNIGKVLSKMLSGIGANVYCEARKEKDIALIEMMGYNGVKLNELDKYLPKADVIFNTVPSIILDKDKLEKIKDTCLIIDLASTPGGIDFSLAKELGLKVIWALSLPSKVAPKSSARYIKEAIYKLEN